MGILRDVYFKLASEDSLRKKTDKMFTKLNKVGFFETEGTKHMRLGNKYNDYVNAIGSKWAKNAPKHGEHGWHLFKK